MKKDQSEAQSIVFFIDDDTSVRQALQRLLRSLGLDSCRLTEAAHGQLWLEIMDNSGLVVAKVG